MLNFTDINCYNFSYYNEIDKGQSILEELKLNKNAHKYHELKIVLERLRESIYSFRVYKYELKQIYIDVDFIQEYYGFPFFILAEVQKIVKETYGVEFEIIHKEELVGTDYLFEFEFTNYKNRNLIKPTECGMDMTQEEKLEAMENSYNEELMAESYQEESDYELPDRKGNCSFKENGIYDYDDTYFEY